MTRDQNEHHVKASDHDMSVSILLFVLLLSIALHIPKSGEIGDADANRQGFFARATNLILNLGLSIGVSSLLLSSRPRNDQNGTTQ